MAFLKELSSDNKSYVGLSRIDEDEKFIDFFNELQSKHSVNFRNLLAMFYVGDEINAPIEVNSDHSVSCITAVSHSNGACIRTMFYIGVNESMLSNKKENEKVPNAFTTMMSSSKVACFKHAFYKPCPPGHDSTKRETIANFKEEGVDSVRSSEEAE